MAAIFNIKVKKGDSYNSGPIRWTRGGQGVDLENLTGKCQVRSAANSGITVTLDVNKLTIDPDNDGGLGWFELVLTSTLSKTIATTGKGPSDITRYYHEVEWSGSGGYVETIMAGNFDVEAEVSQ